MNISRPRFPKAISSTHYNSNSPESGALGSVAWMFIKNHSFPTKLNVIPSLIFLINYENIYTPSSLLGQICTTVLINKIQLPF